MKTTHILLVLALVSSSVFSMGKQSTDLTLTTKTEKQQSLKRATPKVFTKKGALTKVKWAPTEYPNNWKYDIFYYIPANLKTENAKTMVFLHGGGSSTMSRSGSERVVKMYAPDMMKIADALGLVLIMPSGSGLNWGGHGMTMLRRLSTLAKKDLLVDPNKLALVGHSMGGMGITRMALWLVDQYAFFMPLAAGMDERHATESRIAPLFNTTYHHIQGLNDHFKTFITRCRNQVKVTKDFENKYDEKSGLVMEFTNDSHNYNRSLVTKRLKANYTNLKRDLHQKSLHGIFYNRDDHGIPLVYNNIEYWMGSHGSFFWVEATKFAPLPFADGKQLRASVINFTAKAANNEIKIDFWGNKFNNVKTLRVYISDKMLNLSKPVIISIDGKQKIKKTFQKDLAKMNKVRTQKNDSKYDFVNYVDITL